MEQHLEGEENPRWKRAADAKEERFWEARQGEEDEMAKDKVDEEADEKKEEATRVDEPTLQSEVGDSGGAGSSTDLRGSAVKRAGGDTDRPARRVRFEDQHGEKREGEDTNQPTRRVKITEPQGEKRKEMETDFEEHIRSLTELWSHSYRSTRS